MKLGSLFDGSGGFPLAGAINGITPVWASEIEPYPIRVTKARFPQMKHLGSVLDIKGAEIEPVDIITFGSPCQDLSVAGKQLGIHAGERSNLFLRPSELQRRCENMTEQLEGQVSIFDLDSSSGRTCPEHSVATKAKTSGRCLKPSAASPKTDYLFLDLRKASGSTPVAWSAMAGALPGGSTMLNTGECPSVENASTLSQILQANVPEKYFLSAKACAGILRRAEKRGKELPTMLKEALEEVIALSTTQPKSPAL